MTTVLATQVARVHGANMGPTWVLSAPDGPHVGLMNLAISVLYRKCFFAHNTHYIGWIMHTFFTLLCCNPSGAGIIRIPRLLISLSVHHIDGLVQDCSNSTALAMELRSRALSYQYNDQIIYICTSPSEISSFFYCIDIPWLLIS